VAIDKIQGENMKNEIKILTGTNPIDNPRVRAKGMGRWDELSKGAIPVTQNARKGKMPGGRPSR